MKRLEELVRPEVRALQGYHVQPAEGLVKLDAMENPYGLPPTLARELGERLARVAINRYPPADQRALKDRLREAFAIPESLELVLGNGSDEILQILALAVARPGAVALAPEPTFSMYRISAIAAGLNYAGVALRADFALDAESIRDALGRLAPALTWFSYPNNPTGNLFDRDLVLALVDEAPGLVVADEAYAPFAGGATFLGEAAARPNLVVVRTVSKLGLAGLRLGFAACPRPWALELEKLRLPYNVNVLSAAAAEFVLSHREVLDAQAAAIVANRARLEAALDRLPGLRRFPSAANFVLASFPDAPAVFEGLRARGILIRNLHGSHPLLAGCLRFTVGTADENARLVSALEDILA